MIYMLIVFFRFLVNSHKVCDDYVLLYVCFLFKEVPPSVQTCAGTRCPTRACELACTCADKLTPLNSETKSFIIDDCRGTTAGSRRVQEATLKIDGGRSSRISGDGHASKAESPIQGEIKKSRLGRTLKRNRKADCILNSNTKNSWVQTTQLHWSRRP